MAINDNDCVILNLDKPRELRCTHKVLKRFSAMQQINVLEIEAKLWQYDICTAMAYCMLVADDPSLTVDQVDDLLDKIKPSDLILEVNKAFMLAFDEINGEENGTATDGDTDCPPMAAGAGEKA